MTDFQREKELYEEIEFVIRVRKVFCGCVFTDKLHELLYEYNETILKMIYYYKIVLTSSDTILIKRVQAKHMLFYLEDKLTKMREKILA